MSDYTIIVTLSDQHIPYIDKHASEVVMMLLKDLQPHKLILLGDIIDLYQISKFSKNPGRAGTMKQDISLTKDYLTELRNLLPKTEIIYLYGNHEDRLRKHIWDFSPELDKMLSLEDWLKLDELEIKYYNCETDVHKEGVLLFTHGTFVSQDSAMTARRMLKKYGMSIIHGHTHRLGSYYETKLPGPLAAWENGCLCDFSLAREWRQGFPNWQQGFNVIYMKGKRFIVNQVIIYKGSLLWQGKEYNYH